MQALKLLGYFFLQINMEMMRDFTKQEIKEEPEETNVPSISACKMEEDRQTRQASIYLNRLNYLYWLALILNCFFISFSCEYTYCTVPVCVIEI